MASSKKTTSAVTDAPSPKAKAPAKRTVPPAAPADLAPAAKQPVAKKVVAKKAVAKKAAVKSAAVAKAVAPAKKKAKPGGTRVEPAQRANYIEVAAFYIAERRGFAPGNPEQDYLEAAAEIDRLIANGHFGK